MSDVSGLQNEQASVQGQQAEAEYQNAVLREQVARLERCKQIVSTEKGAYRQLNMTDFQRIRAYSYEWKGNTFNTFQSDGGVFLQKGNEYLNAIDATLDALNIKITELKNQIREGEGFIAWCISRLSVLATMIENALN